MRSLKPLQSGRTFSSTSAIDPSASQLRPVAGNVPLPSPDALTAQTFPKRASQLHYSLGHLAMYPPASSPKDVKPVMRHRKEPSSEETPKEADGAMIQQVAQQGIQTPSTMLPFAERIQRSFGQYNVSGIQAHQGTEATESAKALHARAYARGNHVVFAGTPTLYTVAHETAHVVQQHNGIRLADNISKVGDVYEQNADAVARRVVMGQTVEDLLWLPRNAAQPNVTPGMQSSPVPIQRLVGFEGELQVPSFGSEQGGITFKEDATHKATDAIKRFVGGGLKYNTVLGDTLESDPFYKVTTDKSSKTNRQGIIKELIKKGYINGNPDNTASNIEYVTPALDELAPGSDQDFKEQANKLKAHMDKTLIKARSGQMHPLDPPATTGYTGIPSQDLKNWLQPADYDELEPLWKDMAQDSIYIQATVGVIPSALRTLHRQANLQAEAGELNASDVRKDAFTYVDRTIDELEHTKQFEEDSFIKGLKQTSWDALLGVLHLLFLYIVSNTLYQTTAGTRTTVKNAVPFLIKITTKDILSETGTHYLRENEMPKDLINFIAQFLKTNKYATLDYWTKEYHQGGEKLTVRTTGNKKVFEGDYADFIVRALGGTPVGEVSATTGHYLENPDELPEDVESYGQSGIPVEYRWISNRPTTVGLEAQMMKIVAQARELNTKELDEKPKMEVLDRVTKREKRSAERDEEGGRKKAK